jgi:branched-chain amino acid transport system ATP-binding protein
MSAVITQIEQSYEILAQFVARGISLVIVEQYVQRALALANKVYILSRGVRFPALTR